MMTVRRIREFFMGPQLPPGVELPMRPHETLVQWATGRDGEIVAVTNLALWLVRDGQPLELGWHTVNKATWQDGVLSVTPGQVAGSVEAAGVELPVIVAGRPVVVQLPDARRLPEQVQSRVTRSVALSEYVPVSDGGGVRVVARRIAGRDGLRWFVHPDPGVSMTDPEVLAAVHDLFTQLRQEASPVD